MITVYDLSTLKRRKVLTAADTGSKVGANFEGDACAWVPAAHAFYASHVILAVAPTQLACQSVQEYTSLTFSADSKMLLAQGGAPEWNLVLWVWEKSKVAATLKTTNQQGLPVHSVSALTTTVSWVRHTAAYHAQQAQHGRDASDGHTCVCACSVHSHWGAPLGRAPSLVCWARTSSRSLSEWRFQLYKLIQT